jgi:hypothetical protein
MRTRIGYLLLFALTLGVSVKAYRSPFPTFDRLLYAASVAHLHTSDATQIAEQAFRLAGNADYPHTEFTDQLLAQPTLISEQVPFYAIRPIYIQALSLVGLRAVSPLAYLGIVMVLAVWVRSPWWVLPVALLPELLEVAREITPDALSALVVLGGFLLLKRGHMAAGLAALLLSLGVRTDNLFFLVPLLVVLAFERKLDWRVAVGLAVLGSATVAGINHFAHNYGWTALMRRSFAGGLIHPAAGISPISPIEYLGFLGHGVTGLLSVSSLWVLLGALVWLHSKESREILLIAAGFCGLHILALPVAEPRYFVTAVLLLCTLLIETFAKPDSSTTSVTAIRGYASSGKSIMSLALMLCR